MREPDDDQLGDNMQGRVRLLVTSLYRPSKHPDSLIYRDC